MIGTSRQAKRKARQLFLSCLVDGRLDQVRVRHVVDVTLESRPRNYLRVLKSFVQLVRLELAARTATIESAASLPGPVETGIRDRLEATYGPQLSIVAQRNPQLIGGVRIRVGNDVYDGTVQAKLDALRRSFGILNKNGRTPE
jgi:F-type H+-transporting ATPase subunit delta